MPTVNEDVPQLDATRHTTYRPYLLPVDLETGNIKFEHATELNLASYNMTVDVHDFLADSTSTMTFLNKHTEPTSAVFTIPVDETSAVYRFEYEINGEIIHAECREKELAKSTYSESVMQGHTAAVSQQINNMRHIFSCTVATIPSQTTITIRLSQVTELIPDVGGRLSVRMPLVLHPKYGPDKDYFTSHEIFEEPTSSVQNPDPMLVTFTAHIHGGLVIGNLKEVNNRLLIQYLDEAHTEAKAELITEDLTFDKDLVMNIRYKRNPSPTVVAEEGNRAQGGILKKPVAMLTFYPEMAQEIPVETGGEFVFLVDRSMSMEGKRTQDACAALRILLQALPMGCLFNIISFASESNPLYKDASKEKTAESMKEAVDFIEDLPNVEEGSNILTALQKVFKKPSDAEHPRQIFLISDGEVTNTLPIVSLVDANSDDTRVFTIGVGYGVSTSLLQGVAEAGRGRCDFLFDTKHLENRMRKLMVYACQFTVPDVNIEWTLPRGVSVVTLPQILPPLYNHEKWVAYAVFNGKVRPTDELVARLSVWIGESAFTHTLKFQIKPNLDRNNRNPALPIHRMLAKMQINQLEMNKDEYTSDRDFSTILALSSSANILSRYTVFVSVDEHSRPVKAHEKLPMMQQLTVKEQEDNYDQRHTSHLFQTVPNDEKKRKRRRVRFVLAMNNMFRGSARTRASMRRHNEEKRQEKEEKKEDPAKPSQEIPTTAEENEKNEKNDEKADDGAKIEDKESTTYAKQYESPSSKEESDQENTDEQDSCRDVIRLPRYRPEKDSKKRKVAVQEDDFTVTVVHRSPAKELPDDWEDIVAQVGKGEDRRENKGKIPSKELDDAVEMMLKADNDAQMQFEMPEQQTEFCQKSEDATLEAAIPKVRVTEDEIVPVRVKRETFDRELFPEDKPSGESTPKPKMTHSYKMTFSKFFTRKNKDDMSVPKHDEPLDSPSGSPTSPVPASPTDDGDKPVEGQVVVNIIEPQKDDNKTDEPKKTKPAFRIDIKKYMRGGRQSSSTDEDTTPAQSPDATTSSPKDTDSPSATTTTTSTTVVEKDQYFEAKVFTETPDGIVAPLEQPKVQLETDEPEKKKRVPSFKINLPSLKFGRTKEPESVDEKPAGEEKKDDDKPENVPESKDEESPKTEDESKKKFQMPDIHLPRFFKRKWEPDQSVHDDPQQGKSQPEANIVVNIKEPKSDEEQVEQVEETVKPVAIDEDEAEPAENKDEEKVEEVKDVEKVEDREGQREGEEPQKKRKKMPSFHINLPQRRKKPAEQSTDKDTDAAPSEEKKPKDHGRPVFEPFINFVNRKKPKKSDQNVIHVDIETKAPEPEVEVPKVAEVEKPNNAEIEVTTSAEVDLEVEVPKVALEVESPEVETRGSDIDISIRETKEAMQQVEDEIKLVKEQLKDAEELPEADVEHKTIVTKEITSVTVTRQKLIETDGDMTNEIQIERVKMEHNAPEVDVVVVKPEVEDIDTAVEPIQAPELEAEIDVTPAVPVVPAVEVETPKDKVEGQIVVDIKEPQNTDKRHFHMPNIRLPSFSSKKKNKKEAEPSPGTPPPSPIEGTSEDDQKKSKSWNWKFGLPRFSRKRKHEETPPEITHDLPYLESKVFKEVDDGELQVVMNTEIDELEDDNTSVSSKSGKRKRPPSFKISFHSPFDRSSIKRKGSKSSTTTDEGPSPSPVSKEDYPYLGPGEKEVEITEGAAEDPDTTLILVDSPEVDEKDKVVAPTIDVKVEEPQLDTTEKKSRLVFEPVIDFINKKVPKGNKTPEGNIVVNIKEPATPEPIEEAKVPEKVDGEPDKVEEQSEKAEEPEAKDEESKEKVEEHEEKSKDEPKKKSKKFVFKKPSFNFGKKEAQDGKKSPEANIVVNVSEPAAKVETPKVDAKVETPEVAAKVETLEAGATVVVELEQPDDEDKKVDTEKDSEKDKEADVAVEVAGPSDETDKPTKKQGKLVFEPFINFINKKTTKKDRKIPEANIVVDIKEPEKKEEPEVPEPKVVIAEEIELKSEPKETEKGEQDDEQAPEEDGAKETTTKETTTRESPKKMRFLPAFKIKSSAKKDVKTPHGEIVVNISEPSKDVDTTAVVDATGDAVIEEPAQLSKQEEKSDDHEQKEENNDVTSPDANIVVNIEESEKDELKGEEEEPKVTDDKDQHDGAKEKGERSPVFQPVVTFINKKIDDIPRTKKELPEFQIDVNITEPQIKEKAEEEKAPEPEQEKEPEAAAAVVVVDESEPEKEKEPEPVEAPSEEPKPVKTKKSKKNIFEPAILYINKKTSRKSTDKTSPEANIVVNISEPEKPAAEPTEAAVVVKSEEIELQTKPEDVTKDDEKEQPTEEAKEETKEEEKKEEKAGPSDEPKKEKTKKSGKKIFAPAINFINRKTKRDKKAAPEANIVVNISEPGKEEAKEEPKPEEPEAAAKVVVVEEVEPKDEQPQEPTEQPEEVKEEEHKEPEAKEEESQDEKPKGERSPVFQPVISFINKKIDDIPRTKKDLPEFQIDVNITEPQIEERSKTPEPEPEKEPEAAAAVVVVNEPEPEKVEDKEPKPVEEPVEEPADEPKPVKTKKSKKLFEPAILFINKKTARKSTDKTSPEANIVVNISEPEKPAAEPTEAAVVVKSEEIELQTEPEDVTKDDEKEQPTEEAKEETKEEEKKEEKAGPSDEPKKEKTKKSGKLIFAPINYINKKTKREKKQQPEANIVVNISEPGKEEAKEEPKQEEPEAAAKVVVVEEVEPKDEQPQEPTEQPEEVKEEEHKEPETKEAEPSEEPKKEKSKKSGRLIFEPAINFINKKTKRDKKAAPEANIVVNISEPDKEDAKEEPNPEEPEAAAKVVVVEEVEPKDEQPQEPTEQPEEVKEEEPKEPETKDEESQDEKAKGERSPVFQPVISFINKKIDDIPRTKKELPEFQIDVNITEPQIEEIVKEEKAPEPDKDAEVVAVVVVDEPEPEKIEEKDPEPVEKPAEETKEEEKEEEKAGPSEESHKEKPKKSGKLIFAPAINFINKKIKREKKQQPEANIVVNISEPGKEEPIEPEAAAKVVVVEEVEPKEEQPQKPTEQLEEVKVEEPADVQEDEPKESEMKEEAGPSDDTKKEKSKKSGRLMFEPAINFINKKTKRDKKAAPEANIVVNISEPGKEEAKEEPKPEEPEAAAKVVVVEEVEPKDEQPQEPTEQPEEVKEEHKEPETKDEESQDEKPKAKRRLVFEPAINFINKKTRKNKVPEGNIVVNIAEPDGEHAEPTEKVVEPESTTKVKEDEPKEGPSDEPKVEKTKKKKSKVFAPVIGFFKQPKDKKSPEANVVVNINEPQKELVTVEPKVQEPKVQVEEQVELKAEVPEPVVLEASVDTEKVDEPEVVEKEKEHKKEPSSPVFEPIINLLNQKLDNLPKSEKGEVSVEPCIDVNISEPQVPEVDVDVKVSTPEAKDTEPVLEKEAVQEEQAEPKEQEEPKEQDDAQEEEAPAPIPVPVKPAEKASKGKKKRKRNKNKNRGNQASHHPEANITVKITEPEKHEKPEKAEEAQPEEPQEPQVVEPTPEPEPVVVAAEPEEKPEPAAEVVPDDEEKKIKPKSPVLQPVISFIHDLPKRNKDLPEATIDVHITEPGKADEPAGSDDKVDGDTDDKDWTLEAKVFTKTDDGDLVPVVPAGERSEEPEQEPQTSEPKAKEDKDENDGKQKKKFVLPTFHNPLSGLFAKKAKDDKKPAPSEQEPEGAAVPYETPEEGKDEPENEPQAACITVDIKEPADEPKNEEPKVEEPTEKSDDKPKSEKPKKKKKGPKIKRGSLLADLGLAPKPKPKHEDIEVKIQLPAAPESPDDEFVEIPSPEVNIEEPRLEATVTVEDEAQPQTIEVDVERPEEPEKIEVSSPKKEKHNLFEPVIVGINKKLHRDPKPVKSSEGETADPNEEGDAKPEEKESETPKAEATIEVNITEPNKDEEPKKKRALPYVKFPSLFRSKPSDRIEKDKPSSSSQGSAEPLELDTSIIPLDTNIEPDSKSNSRTSSLTNDPFVIEGKLFREKPDGTLEVVTPEDLDVEPTAPMSETDAKEPASKRRSFLPAFLQRKRPGSSSDTTTPPLTQSTPTQEPVPSTERTSPETSDSQNKKKGHMRFRISNPFHRHPKDDKKFSKADTPTTEEPIAAAVPYPSEDTPLHKVANGTPEKESAVKPTYVPFVENSPVHGDSAPASNKPATTPLDEGVVVYPSEAKVFDPLERPMSEGEAAARSLMNAHRDSGLPNSPSNEFPPEMPPSIPHDEDQVEKEKKLAQSCHLPMPVAVEELIALQTSNGCWTLDEQLADLLGASPEKLESKQPGKGGEVWATALALAWLDHHEHDKRVTWVKNENKALKWLDGQSLEGMNKTKLRTMANDALSPVTE